MLTDSMRVEVSVPCALLYRFLEHGQAGEDDRRILFLLKRGANFPMRDLTPKKQRSIVKRCQRAEQAVLALFREPESGRYLDGAIMGHALLLWLAEAFERDHLVIEEGDRMDVAINYLSDELKPHWPRAQLYAPEFVPLIWAVLHEQGLYLR